MHIGKYKINKKVVFLIVLFIIVYSIGLGFSYINTDINVNSNGTIKKVDKGPNCDQNTNSLYCVMKKGAVLDNIQSRFVTSSTGIDFSQNSSDTNGKGVYLRAGTENDLYPIYYYRGNVTDNNIIFANYCWKMVRTTNTGGVKLIYNGEPSDGKCNNTGEAAQLTTSKFNERDLSPVYVGYMYGKMYSYRSSRYESFKGEYANDITYENGQYTLIETTSSLDSKHHYACADSTTSCETVRYYFEYSDYIELTGGEKVEDALDEMFSNETNSTIKDYIENTWYKEKMTDVTEKLEDTIYCNDRSLYSRNGWDSNGESNSISLGLSFGAAERAHVTFIPSLDCIRSQDQFTVSNSIGNGKLKYPVGLLTADEVMLAGGSSNSNKDYYLNSNSTYWLLSPFDYDRIVEEYYSEVCEVDSSGALYNYNGMPTNTYGVRPAVSLKSGTVYTNGNGSPDTPYVVE